MVGFHHSMSPTPSEQTNDLGERGGNRINGAIRRGISRESLFSRFFGLDALFPLPSPKRPRHPLDISLGPSHFHPSVTRLPVIIRVLPGRAGDNHKPPPQKPRGGDSKGDTDSVPFEALLERLRETHYLANSSSSSYVQLSASGALRIVLPV